MFFIFAYKYTLYHIPFYHKFTKITIGKKIICQKITYYKSKYAKYLKITCAQTTKNHAPRRCRGAWFFSCLWILICIDFSYRVLENKTLLFSSSYLIVIGTILKSPPGVVRHTETTYFPPLSPAPLLSRPKYKYILPDL